MKIILLCGWTTLEPKAGYQVKSIAQLGYHVSLITSDSFGRSQSVLSKNCKYYTFIKTPSRSPLQEIKRILLYLYKYKKSINKVVITPMSYTSLFTIFLCGLFSIDYVLLEWGSITDLNKVNLILKFLASSCYRYSKKVVYKEPHMKRILSSLFFKPSSNLIHLPNCIDTDQENIKESQAKHFNLQSFDIDFLWANRPIWRRYPELFLSASLQTCFSNYVFRMYGMNSHTSDITEQKFLSLVKKVNKYDSNIIQSYSFDIYDIFSRSKYFILASRDIYGNNSLLESMAIGLVPIVSNTYWTRDFVPKESAIIFDNNLPSFYAALKLASNLNSNEYQERSEHVKQWVTDKFSLNDWKKRFKELI